MKIIRRKVMPVASIGENWNTSGFRLTLTAEDFSRKHRKHPFLIEGHIYTGTIPNAL